jgi:hypothetical protein
VQIAVSSVLSVLRSSSDLSEVPSSTLHSRFL